MGRLCSPHHPLGQKVSLCRVLEKAFLQNPDMIDCIVPYHASRAVQTRRAAAPLRLRWGNTFCAQCETKMASMRSFSLEISHNFSSPPTRCSPRQVTERIATAAFWRRRKEHPCPRPLQQERQPWYVQRGVVSSLPSQVRAKYNVCYKSATDQHRGLHAALWYVYGGRPNLLRSALN